MSIDQRNQQGELEADANTSLILEGLVFLGMARDGKGMPFEAFAPDGTMAEKSLTVEELAAFIPRMGESHIIRVVAHQLRLDEPTGTYLHSGLIMAEGVVIRVDREAGNAQMVDLSRPEVNAPVVVLPFDAFGDGQEKLAFYLA